MTKQRQKTRREPNTIWIPFAIIGWSFFVIITSGVIINDLTYANVQDLKEQLSECQDKVPVWTLDYKCEVLHDGFEDNLYFVTKTEYYSFEFNDYDSYKLIKERFEKRDLKTCEVIE